MLTVPLHGKRAAGRVALVDDGDFDLVMRHKWYVIEGRGENGNKVHGPYAITYMPPGTKPKSLHMHVLIMGRKGIDHIDLDGLNNQRSNLRISTRSQNGANSLSRQGTSRFKGVSWDKQGRYWRAQITVNRKMRMIGNFGLDEEAAARAYDTAALEAWGEYARLNFPAGEEMA